MVACQAYEVDGYAVCLLRLYSRAFHDMIEPFQFHRIRVHGCINMERLVPPLQILPEERRSTWLVLYHGPLPTSEGLLDLVRKARDYLTSPGIMIPS
jgi:hypothetical protein